MQHGPTGRQPRSDVAAEDAKHDPVCRSEQEQPVPHDLTHRRENTGSVHDRIRSGRDREDRHQPGGHSPDAPEDAAGTTSPGGVGDGGPGGGGNGGQGGRGGGQGSGGRGGAHVRSPVWVSLIHLAHAQRTESFEPPLHAPQPFRHRDGARREPPGPTSVESSTSPNGSGSGGGDAGRILAAPAQRARAVCGAMPARAESPKSSVCRGRQGDRAPTGDVPAAPPKRTRARKPDRQSD